MLTDDGKVYVNKSTSAYFEKIELFEILTNEKIVDIESYDTSSNSCFRTSVALIGESGAKYYPLLECVDAGHTISKASLTNNEESANSLSCIPK